ncbi:MAG: hypothetical protein WC511_01810 [Candidatus Pacearchaeota archaeon]
MDKEKKILRQIEKHIAGLNKAMEELRKIYPKANYYLEDSDNFNVMIGDTHDEKDKPLHENVLKLFFLHYSGGGGW